VAAGSAKNAAHAIAGAFKNLDTLDKAGKTRSPATTAARRRAVSRTPANAHQATKTYEDPAAIKAGMSSAELLTRFGEPSMKVSSSSAEQTLYYARKDGRGQIAVRIVDGQVISPEAGVR